MLYISSDFGQKMVLYEEEDGGEKPCRGLYNAGGLCRFADVELEAKTEKR